MIKIAKEREPEYSGNVKIKLESAVVTSDRSARVLVYDGERLVAEILAEMRMGLGADYGMYHYVTLHPTQKTVCKLLV
ncbi:hypothetical protein HYW46_02800 [Candidatus Daviesbacteria bacterium]|nr:hypothetical protein [Candidatus Daviesbacteria bacterium]